MHRGLQYFRHCPACGKSGAAIAAKLVRGGIEDMDTLCEQMAQEPQKVAQIRDIGPESMRAIRCVCAAYRNERSDTG